MKGKSEMTMFDSGVFR